jgi:SAM-dependent methyltransferase
MSWRKKWTKPLCCSSSKRWKTFHKIKEFNLGGAHHDERKSAVCGPSSAVNFKEESVMNRNHSTYTNHHNHNHTREWWSDGAGFFGRHYMEGDNSLNGYRAERQTLEQRTQMEAEGVIRLLGLQPGQSLLDCPCGYGRHSIALAQRGIQVVGVDINSEELQVALVNSPHYPMTRFVQQDMRHLLYQDSFDAVINMFYSFGFFESDEENIEVLRRFYRALKPGGKFLMHTDVNVARVMRGDYVFSEIRPLTSGRRIQQREYYDAERKRIVGTWHILNGDDSLDEAPPYSMRVYTYDEYVGWCRTVGFREFEAYAYWDGAPFSEESEDMIVIATK